MSEHEARDEKQNPLEPFTQVNESVERSVDAAGNAVRATGHEPTPMVPGVGLITGFADFATGMAEMFQGHEIDGALNAGSGLVNVVGATADMGGKKAVSEAAGKAAPVVDALQMLNDLRKGQYDKAANDGASAGLGFINPALGAAYKLGNSGGELLNRGDRDYTARNDPYGGHRTTRQWAVDNGHWVRDHVPVPILDDVAGLTTTLATGTGGTIYTNAGELGDGLWAGAKASAARPRASTTTARAGPSR